MFILGITGPTGSGKSLLCQTLSAHCIPVLDADEIYHGLLLPPSPCLDALRSAFGNEIFLKDGSLHRPALSDLVFHDKAKLELLNHTVLGFVLNQLRAEIRELERKGYTHVAVDAPTLFESGFDRECHRVIAVLASPELRLERILRRDGIDRSRAAARIAAQKEDAFYESRSDAVLYNNGDPQDLVCQIEELARAWELPL